MRCDVKWDLMLILHKVDIMEDYWEWLKMMIDHEV
jgi:hypothetical protein